MAPSAAAGGWIQRKHIRSLSWSIAMANRLFLKIESDGRDQIQGDSKDEDHRNWIDVLGFRINVAVPKAGPKPDAKAKTAPGGISFTKLADRSAGALYQAIGFNTKI